jgi:hypothetical protein
VQISAAGLALGFCMLLAGCGETAEPPKGPTANDEAVRQQMLEFDKANKISAKVKKRN